MWSKAYACFNAYAAPVKTELKRYVGLLGFSVYFSYSHLNRTLMEFAWASKPSLSASRMMSSLYFLRASLVQPIRLVRLIKVSTETGEKKRAVPEVEEHGGPGNVVAKGLR